MIIYMKWYIYDKYGMVYDMIFDMMCDMIWFDKIWYAINDIVWYDTILFGIEWFDMIHEIWIVNMVREWRLKYAKHD